MNRIPTLAALFLILTIAATPAAAQDTDTPGVKPPARMLGTWEMKIVVDQDELKKNLEKVDDPAQRTMLENLLPILARMDVTLTLNKDQTYNMKMVLEFAGKKQEREQQGTWKVLKVDKNQVVMESTGKEDKKTEKHNLEFKSDTHMVETPQDKEFQQVRSAIKVHYRKATEKKEE